MMKYVIGFVLGAVLFSSGIVFAKTFGESKFYGLDKIEVYAGYVQKVYDEDTKTVCYVFSGGYKGGISCLKNN